MSDETTGKPDKTNFDANDRPLIFAMIIGPVAVLLNESISYSLVSTACERSSKTMLYVTTIIFLLVSLSGALLGRRFSGNDGGSTEGITERDERLRWMGTAAVVLSLGCALVILAMVIPNVILRSCE
jgi:hypothetical protein